jgi:hypothetical protein
MDGFAQEVINAAAMVLDACKLRPGTHLDYTEASLTVVEELLGEAAEYVATFPPERLTVLIQQFGCYILEVGRREFGGRYLWHREQPVLVVGEPIFRVAMITWDKVRGRVNGDTADNIPFFYAGFADRARRAKPGDDALYA